MRRSAKLILPRTVWLGPGSLEHLGEEAAHLGRKALLVTGRSALREAGATNRIIAQLAAAGVDVELFDDAPPEPDVACVDRARQSLREAGCDVVVEAGGGSALDVGKATAALAMGKAQTVEYLRGLDLPPTGLPHLAVPTTAGTGSEATPNSVLSDPEARLKKSIRGPSLLPDVCLVDGDLTVSCPPNVTAASGMDALAQAIESFLSIHATPITDALSLEAAGLIAGSLHEAYAHGGHREARDRVAQGSFLAGVALANARLGAVHGLAHPLGLLYHLPHGVVCAVLLPHVLERNAPACAGKMTRLEAALGADPLQKVPELHRTLGLPQTLGPRPDAEWERAILDYALPSGSSRANPVPVDEAYVRGILDAVCT